MHDARVMHRDIKPANIFLATHGRVKLGDLGLGRAFSSQTYEAMSKVGTPLYMSPEVLDGRGYEWKSDVWSLGCLLYELATLRSPFKAEGDNLYTLFKKISSGKCAAALTRPLTLTPAMTSGKSCAPAAPPAVHHRHQHRHAHHLHRPRQLRHPHPAAAAAGTRRCRSSTRSSSRSS